MRFGLNYAAMSQTAPCPPGFGLSALQPLGLRFVASRTAPLLCVLLLALMATSSHNAAPDARAGRLVDKIHEHFDLQLIRSFMKTHNCSAWEALRSQRLGIPQPRWEALEKQSKRHDGSLEQRGKQDILTIPEQVVLAECIIERRITSGGAADTLSTIKAEVVRMLDIRADKVYTTAEWKLLADREKPMSKAWCQKVLAAAQVRPSSIPCSGLGPMPLGIEPRCNLHAYAAA